MSTVIYCKGLSKAKSKKWENVLIDDKIKDLLDKNYDVKIGIQFFEDVEEIFEYSLLNIVETYDNTIKDIGSLMLSTVLPEVNLAVIKNTPPSSDTVNYAYYTNAFKAGYKVTPTKLPLMIPPDTYGINELKDLVLTREGFTTDLTEINKSCLVTVGNLLHRTSRTSSNSFIVDGNVTLRKWCDNSFNTPMVGLYGFSDIGQIDYLDFKDCRLSFTKLPNGIVDTIYIKLPKSINKKSLFMSLGGKLISLSNGLFSCYGVDAYSFKPRRFDLNKWYRDTKNRLELDFLNLDLNDQNVNMNNVYTEENIVKILNLTQSFLFTIDNPNVLVKFESLNSSNISGQWLNHSEEPTSPIFKDNEITDYWKTQDKGQWYINSLPLLNYKDEPYQTKENKQSLVANIDLRNQQLVNLSFIHFFSF